MKRQKAPVKRSGVHEFILCSLFVYVLVDLLIRSISTNPNFSDIAIYVLLLFLTLCLYKPTQKIVSKLLTCIVTKLKILHSDTSFIKIEEIDQMTGYEFEDFLKHFFEKHGYIAEVTQRSSDFGADLILTKGSKKFVVQAKRLNTKVGIRAVQEVVAAIKYYKANEAMVVSNQYYSSPAIKLAKSNHVRLIDREELMKMIR